MQNVCCEEIISKYRDSELDGWHDGQPFKHATKLAITTTFQQFSKKIFTNYENFLFF